MALACICTSGVLAVATSAGASSGPTLKGPILSRAETPSITWARDGGVTVPLPNGKDFWIFGDAPRYQWTKSGWHMNTFIYGSTAAQRSFTPGKPLAGPLTEVHVGHPTKTTNGPTQFLPLPHLYIPDGSGRACTKANGGRTVESVRWVTGATLMPDKTNIFIPYVEVCVMSEFGYVSEGWGFTLYNYKANKFSMKPYAVFPPSTDGTSLPSNELYGSPILKNGKITFYSWSFGGSAGGIYSTTVKATLAALKNPSSYAPHADARPAGVVQHQCVKAIEDAPQDHDVHAAGKRG